MEKVRVCSFRLDARLVVCNSFAEVVTRGMDLWQSMISWKCGKIMDGIQAKRGWQALVLILVGTLMTAAVTSNLAMAQAPKPISVRVVDKAGYDKVIAANKGKIIVVDCWATWCVPCRKAFPKTVELSKAYADKDVVVVSLCFDEPVKGQAPPMVKKFLSDSNAQFENLVSSLDISSEGAEAFAIPDGALPHFKIYGKDGKLFKAFESGEGKDIKHEEIEAAVKKAIGAK
jgi:thiol-disulfide isomerase/thioredoxin